MQDRGANDSKECRSFGCSFCEGNQVKRFALAFGNMRRTFEIVADNNTQVDMIKYTLDWFIVEIVGVSGRITFVGYS